MSFFANFSDNEILILIIAASAEVVVLLPYARTLRARIPSPRLAFHSFHVLVIGWLFTNLEHLWAPVLFNCGEHCCYALSSILFTLWVGRIFAPRKAPA